MSDITISCPVEANRDLPIHNVTKGDKGIVWAIENIDSDIYLLIELANGNNIGPSCDNCWDLKETLLIDPLIKEAESKHPCVGCNLFEQNSIMHIRNPRNCMKWLRQKNECPHDDAASSSAEAASANKDNNRILDFFNRNNEKEKT